MKKRMLALVLSLVLLIGILPTGAFAAGEEDLAQQLKALDLSGVPELDSVTVSSTESLPERHPTRATSNICLPSASTHEQHAQYGQEVILEYTLLSYGGYNQEYGVFIFDSEEITEEHLIAYIAGDFPNYSAATEVYFIWDTTEFSNGPGEYHIISCTAYGDNIDEMYETTVTLTRDYIPLEQIYFRDPETLEPVYNRNMLPGDEGEYIIGYSPVNASTPDRRATVTTGNADDAIVDGLGGYYFVTAQSCGQVAINVQSAGKSANLYLNIDHLDADGNYFCDYAPCWRLMFTDVPANTWYYNSVVYAVKNGLMNGMGNNLFQPDGVMTRAQLVTVLWRYEGSPVLGTNTFTDVANNVWYTQAVTWAADQGIVTGVGNGKFNPDGTITREQLVTIFYRYSAMKLLDTSARAELSSFPDQDKVSPWAMDAMQWAVSVGLISGNAHSGNTWLEPQGNATRAQVSAIFQRFIDKVPELLIDQKVALVTDYGSITDGAYNEAAYFGMMNFCEDNAMDFAYYVPVEDSAAARIAAVDLAVEEGANVVILPGYLFGEVLLKVQKQYPNVKFIALDVGEGDLTEDYVNYEKPAANAVTVTYKTEQAGYLAGYAAVKAGYTSLGFVGGMRVPDIIRYGAGFIQGANAAAEELAISDVVEIRYVYANQFFGDADITAYCDALYSQGTEVIFACGGGLFTSAAEAAAKCGGKVIGVDVDQSALIDELYGEGITFTSAMKGLSFTTEYLLERYFDRNEWYGGQILNLGVQHGGTAQYGHIMLPDSTQFNESFTRDDYIARWNSIAQGRIAVSETVPEGEDDIAITVFYLEDIK